MTSQQTPSRRLRIAASLAGLLFWTVLVIWVFIITVWCSLTAYFLPRINEYRPWLERFISQKIGEPIHIGSLRVVSNGLLPHLVMKNIEIMDKKGNSALWLPLVVITISPRSALNLKMEQLYIEAPNLYVERDTKGELWVGGIHVSMDNRQDNPFMNWLFQQRQIQIRDGTIHWQDHLHKLSPITFSQGDLLIANGFFKHAFRIDVTPPSSWGQRISVRGKMSQSLLQDAGVWQKWYGQIYADAPSLDLANIAPYLPTFGISLQQGRGSLRAWMSVENARLENLTADVHLSQVSLQVRRHLEPLSLPWMRGRFSIHQIDNTTSYGTEGLQFSLDDNHIWPGGNVSFSVTAGKNSTEDQYAIQGKNLDISAIKYIAKKLPMPDQSRSILNAIDPRGVINTIQAKWQLTPHLTYFAQGNASHLSFNAFSEDHHWVPGIQNANISFNFNQNGGSSSFTMRNGSVDFSKTFDESIMPFTNFSGLFTWHMAKQQLSISGQQIHINNPDIKNAQLQFTWSKANNTPALPGIINLTGTIDEINLTRLYRYLPNTMLVETRNYLRDMFVQGSAQKVHLKLMGNLHTFPFQTKQAGVFQITGQVKNARVRYAQDAQDLPKNIAVWPLLNVHKASVVLNEGNIDISDITGSLTSWPAINFNNSQVAVNHLYNHSLLSVGVNLRASGSLPEMLGMLNQTPMVSLSGHALKNAHAEGNANYTAQLSIPVSSPEHTSIAAAIQLKNNRFQFAPNIPPVSYLNGSINFTEKRLWTSKLQGRALGGPVQIQGGLSFSPDVSASSAPQKLTFSGIATAQGLSNAENMNRWSYLLRGITGSTTYHAQVELGSHLLPKIQIRSSLQGLGLTLPPPFNKPSATPLPLRIAITPILHERSSKISAGNGTPNEGIRIEVGQTLYANFVREPSTDNTYAVKKGVVLLTSSAKPIIPTLPESGISVSASLDKLDVNAWINLIDTLPPSHTRTLPGTGDGVSDFLPTHLVIDAKELSIKGQTLHTFKLIGDRKGNLWKSRIQSDELNGLIEYQQGETPQSSRIYARLSNLTIGKSSAKKVGNILEEQPSTLPALDIEVNQFSLKGKDLGKLVVNAINTRTDNTVDWKLNHLTLTTPDAVLTTTGHWTADPSNPANQKTTMNFVLNIKNAGDLLNRFDMDGIVKKGHGAIKGEVHWIGSPLSLNFKTMNGGFNVNVESGQFLKADPGLAKLFGILSLQALPRRLTLDFRDVFTEGFSFDFFRGDLNVLNGMATTSNLQMKGVNAVVMMDGRADLANETQSIKVLVVPNLSTGTAALIASVINPVIGLSTFVAQYVLNNSISKAATQEFQVDGTWDKPVVHKLDTTHHLTKEKHP